MTNLPVIGLILITQIVNSSALSAFGAEAGTSDVRVAEAAQGEVDEASASAQAEAQAPMQAHQKLPSYEEVIAQIPEYQKSIAELKWQLTQAQTNKLYGELGYELDLLPGGLAVVSAMFFGRRAVTGYSYSSSAIADFMGYLNNGGSYHSYEPYLNARERLQAALIGLVVTGAIAGITARWISNNHYEIQIAKDDMARLQAELDPLQARLELLESVKRKVDAQVARQEAN